MRKNLRRIARHRVDGLFGEPESIERFHFRLLGVGARLRKLLIIELFLSAFQVKLGCLEVNCGQLLGSRFPGDGYRLTGIAHFLDRRRRFASSHEQCCGKQHSLEY